MEFSGIGIPWNFPWNFSWNSVEIHRNLWNFMKLRLMEFHGNQWNSMENSTEFREFTQFDGIRFRQGGPRFYRLTGMA
jgi:hypothetical protein